jgi:drug/metabolite transporter (DMT)-like permease
MKRSIPLHMSWKRASLYMLRALINYAAFYTWIKSMNEIGINEATAIIYLHPFWACVMARIMCRDKFDLLTAIVILVNIFSVGLILGPKFNNTNSVGVFICLLSSVLWAAQDIVCKKQTASEDQWLQTFYTFVATIILALPLAILEWKPMSIEVFGLLSVLSVVGVVNVVTFFISFCYASVVTLSPFNSARMLFTILLAYLFSQTSPTPELIIGSAILIAANTYYFIKSIKQYEKI